MLQKIAHWYFSKSALPYWGVVLLDCLAIFISGCLVVVLTEGAVATILQWKAVRKELKSFVRIRQTM